MQNQFRKKDYKNDHSSKIRSKNIFIKKKPPDLLVNHVFQRSGLMLNNIIQELKSLLLVACLVYSGFVKLLNLEHING